MGAASRRIQARGPDLGGVVLRCGVPSAERICDVRERRRPLLPCRTSEPMGCASRPLVGAELCAAGQEQIHRVLQVDVPIDSVPKSYSSIVCRFWPFWLSELYDSLRTLRAAATLGLDARTRGLGVSRTNSTSGTLAARNRGSGQDAARSS